MVRAVTRGESLGQLPRAGWHILSSDQLAGAKPPPQELEAEGARLVVELARSWSSKYDHTIRSTGCRDSAHHYECIFSQPLNEKPVPASVVYSRFALLVPPPSVDSAEPAMPRLLFSFEEGDLRHEWKLFRGAGGRLEVAAGPQDASLRHGYFEEFLDKLIAEKEKMNSRGIDLVTPFEATRLPRPSADEDLGNGEISDGDGVDSEDESGDRGSKLDASFSGGVNLQQSQEADPEMAQALRQALREAGLACDSVPPPASLTELLANVFDAADEEDAGELSHYEVSRLLGATLSGLGLRPWDIQLLMTSAQENQQGFIELKPFAQTAPEIIQELRRRRLAYVALGLPKVDVSSEAVKHCFGAELSETADALAAVITQRSQEDPTSVKSNTPEPISVQALGSSNRRSSKLQFAQVPETVEPVLPDGEFRMGIRRSDCRDCILSLPMRISPQEANRLLQMLPEDEDGFLGVDTLEEQLEELRTGALLNSLVESDPVSLRKHLVVCFRQLGLTEEGTLKVWQLRHALLAADQVCLSRLQIHMLLCLATPHTDMEGNVDVRAFSAVLGAVIPHMLDAQIFMEIAERLQLEAAELQRMRENAELAALGASKLNSGDEKEKTQDVEVDQETVEKILIQALGDGRGPTNTMMAPESLFASLHAGDQQIQSCQLSEFEIGGLAAEMVLDSRGEVAYVEHIKRTVPMIFELRRSQLLSQYVIPDGLDMLLIFPPTAAEADAIFPLLPPSEKKEEVGQGSSKRRQSKRRSSSKEPTGEAISALKVRAHLSAVPTDRRTSMGTSVAPSGPVMGRGYERRKTLSVEASSSACEAAVDATKTA
eukprot:TRINITY_DN45999_c0_g1_i1.p1 TRINITY_DN45999_c0_g1~~TRINITY_DN45999_c0_g1_i1.p1  ORF type:complete len:829 (+),score=201.33 TRINITY_DN45999_c0_g1_i1:91-2577(+)